MFSNEMEKKPKYDTFFSIELGKILFFLFLLLRQTNAYKVIDIYEFVLCMMISEDRRIS